MNMRIGLDARFYSGEQSKGLGRYTQKLLEYLSRFDTTNEYVVFLREAGYKQWPFSVRHLIPVLAPYRWYSVQEQFALPYKINKTKIDFVHFLHFNVPLICRQPFLVTIHDLIIQRFPTERATTLGPFFYKIKHFAGEEVLRHAVKVSKKIFTVSEFSKNDIVKYFKVNPEKIVVTYEAPGIEDIKNDIDFNFLQKKYGLNKPYLLYIGNAYPHKNLEILLKVFKKLSEENTVKWDLVLVGKMDYFYQRLRQFAQQEGVIKYVKFLGFVPDTELPGLYRHAEMYIFPSLYEGFGLPALEAMKFQTPVLAARSSCLPEILGEAACYFDPKDISGIIKAIKEVDRDQTLRQKLIEEGSRQVQCYSWEKMGEKIVKVYEQMHEF